MELSQCWSLQFLEIEFMGRAVHAGTQPWEGLRALHTMELLMHTLNLF
jgi:metal-dependent amidase/aminoacylase/carboxypeptidase family protein